MGGDIVVAPVMRGPVKGAFWRKPCSDIPIRSLKQLIQNRINAARQCVFPYLTAPLAQSYGHREAHLRYCLDPKYNAELDQAIRFEVQQFGRIKVQAGRRCGKVLATHMSSHMYM